MILVVSPVIKIPVLLHFVLLYVWVDWRFGLELVVVDCMLARDVGKLIDINLMISGSIILSLVDLALFTLFIVEHMIWSPE
jgi:hypothetical protein